MNSNSTIQKPTIETKPVKDQFIDLLLDWAMEEIFKPIKP